MVTVPYLDGLALDRAEVFVLAEQRVRQLLAEVHLSIALVLMSQFIPISTRFGYVSYVRFLAQIHVTVADTAIRNVKKH